MTAPRDPRDLGRIFGSLQPAMAGKGASFMPVGPEATLRVNFASTAHAYGWLVEEEVAIPGWGRIDLVLRDGVGHPHLIELKINLARSSEIRRALQQADGYGRWWVQAHGEAAQSHLVGCHVDKGLLASMSAAYPEVDAGDLGLLTRGLRWWGCNEGIHARHARSISRLRNLRRVTLAYEAALDEMDADLRDRVAGRGGA